MRGGGEEGRRGGGETLGKGGGREGEGKGESRQVKVVSVHTPNPLKLQYSLVCSSPFSLSFTPGF